MISALSSRRRFGSGRGQNTPQIITTPVENIDDDISYYTTTKHSLLHPTTPSPQAVDEFDQAAVTSANRSAEVSKLLSDHLVVLTPTPGVCITEDEVIMDEAKVSLPELEEHQNNSSYNEHSMSEDYSVPPTYSTLPPQMKSIMSNIRSTTTSATRPLSPNSLSHKMLFSSVSSIVSPPQHFNLQQHSLLVEEERQVIFHNVSLGIKISRHSDGYVRVLSVTPPKSTPKREGDSSNEGENKPARTGDEIHVGDVVRQVSDVNLRMPIDSAVWKLTVGLIKMAPRPLQFIVAKEIKKQEEKREDEVSKRGLYRWPSRADRIAAGEEESVQEPETTTTTNAPQPSHFFTGPTRTIHFLESALGVKLHHNTSGYVQILSVAPYKSFPNSPLARTGDSIYAGDVVLEVGGVWNLREPIDKVEWGTLITFIKESKRPLSMVVGDADSLMILKKETELSLEKEEEEVKEANDLALSEAEEENKSFQDKEEDTEKKDQEDKMSNDKEETASSLEDKGLEEAVSSTEAEETGGNEDREESSNECNVDDSTTEEEDDGQ